MKADIEKIECLRMKLAELYFEKRGQNPEFVERMFQIDIFKECLKDYIKRWPYQKSGGARAPEYEVFV